MMEIDRINQILTSKKRYKVSESESNDDAQGEMKEFLLGLKDRLDNEENEEQRHKKPRFAESKKSIFSKVVFELEDTGISHIISA